MLGRPCQAACQIAWALQWNQSCRLLWACQMIFESSLAQRPLPVHVCCSVAAAAAVGKASETPQQMKLAWLSWHPRQLQACQLHEV